MNLHRVVYWSTCRWQMRHHETLVFCWESFWRRPSARQSTCKSWWRYLHRPCTLYVFCGRTGWVTLQEVYRSVVVARLLYAASAWHGFTKASEHQRINSLLERAKRCGYCEPSLPTFEELCQTMQMTNFFNFLKLFAVLTMFCTLCCHRYLGLQHRSITIFSDVNGKWLPSRYSVLFSNEVKVTRYFT